MAQCNNGHVLRLGANVNVSGSGSYSGGVAYCDGCGITVSTSAAYSCPLCEADFCNQCYSHRPTKPACSSHHLTMLAAPRLTTCVKCSLALAQGAPVFSCRACDSVICLDCHSKKSIEECFEIDTGPMGPLGSMGPLDYIDVDFALHRSDLDQDSPSIPSENAALAGFGEDSAELLPTFNHTVYASLRQFISQAAHQKSMNTQLCAFLRRALSLRTCILKASQLEKRESKQSDSKKDSGPLSAAAERLMFVGLSSMNEPQLSELLRSLQVDLDSCRVLDLLSPNQTIQFLNSSFQKLLQCPSSSTAFTTTSSTSSISCNSLNSLPSTSISPSTPAFATSSSSTSFSTSPSLSQSTSSISSSSFDPSIVRVTSPASSVSSTSLPTLITSVSSTSDSSNCLSTSMSHVDTITPMTSTTSPGLVSSTQELTPRVHQDISFSSELSLTDSKVSSDSCSLLPLCPTFPNTPALLSVLFNFALALGRLDNLLWVFYQALRARPGTTFPLKNSLQKLITFDEKKSLEGSKSSIYTAASESASISMARASDVDAESLVVVGLTQLARLSEDQVASVGTDDRREHTIDSVSNYSVCQAEQYGVTFSVVVKQRAFTITGFDCLEKSVGRLSIYHAVGLVDVKAGPAGWTQIYVKEIHTPDKDGKLEPSTGPRGLKITLPPNSTHSFFFHKNKDSSIRYQTGAKSDIASTSYLEHPDFSLFTGRCVTSVLPFSATGNFRKWCGRIIYRFSEGADGPIPLKVDIELPTFVTLHLLLRELITAHRGAPNPSNTLALLSVLRITLVHTSNLRFQPLVMPPALFDDLVADFSGLLTRLPSVESEAREIANLAGSCLLFLLSSETNPRATISIIMSLNKEHPSRNSLLGKHLSLFSMRPQLILVLVNEIENTPLHPRNEFIIDAAKQMVDMLVSQAKQSGEAGTNMRTMLRELISTLIGRILSYIPITTRPTTTATTPAPGTATTTTSTTTTSAPSTPTPTTPLLPSSSSWVPTSPLYSTPGLLPSYSPSPPRPTSLAPPTITPATLVAQERAPVSFRALQSTDNDNDVDSKEEAKRVCDIRRALVSVFVEIAGYVLENISHVCNYYLEKTTNLSHEQSRSCALLGDFGRELMYEIFLISSPEDSTLMFPLMPTLVSLAETCEKVLQLRKKCVAEFEHETIPAPRHGLLLPNSENKVTRISLEETTLSNLVIRCKDGVKGITFKMSNDDVVSVGDPQIPSGGTMSTTNCGAQFFAFKGSVLTGINTLSLMMSSDGLTCKDMTAASGAPAASGVPFDDSLVIFSRFGPLAVKTIVVEHTATTILNLQVIYSRTSPLFAWLTEQLAADIMTCVGQLGACLLRGEPQTKAESTNSFWLKSSLFAGGLDHGKAGENMFIQQLIRNAEPAKSLLGRLTQLSKPNHMGYPASILIAADEARRATFAALLKHTLLLSVAAAAARQLHGNVPVTTNLTSMVKLWHKSAQVKTMFGNMKGQIADIGPFILETRARIQLLLEIQSGEFDEGSAQDEEELEQLAESTEDEEKLPESMPKEPLARHLSQASLARRPARNRARKLLKLLKNSINVAAHMNYTVRQSVDGSSSAVLVVQEILQFLQTGASVFLKSGSSGELDVLKEALQTQRDRAFVRLQTLEYFRKALELANAWPASMCACLLRSLSTAFTVNSPFSFPTDCLTVCPPTHYLSGIDTVGATLSKQISDKYFACVVPKTPRNNVDLLYMLDCLNIDLRLQDLLNIQSCRLVPLLTALVSFAGSTPALLQKGYQRNFFASCERNARGVSLAVKQAAWCMFRLIAYHLVDCETISSQAATSSLATEMLDSLFLLMEIALDARAYVLANTSDVPKVWTCVDCAFLNRNGEQVCALCALPKDELRSEYQSEQPKVILIPPNCKGNHGLAAFETPVSDYCCNYCGTLQNEKTPMRGCRTCDHDACLPCYEREMSRTVVVVPPRSQADDSKRSLAWMNDAYWAQHPKHTFVDASVGWLDAGCVQSSAVTELPCRTEYPSFNEITMYLNQILWVLLRCTRGSQFRKAMIGPRWLGVFLPLLLEKSSTSYSTQIIVTRICASLLPHVPTGSLASTISRESLVSSLFDLISSCSLPPHVKNEGSPQNSLNVSGSTGALNLSKSVSNPLTPTAASATTPAPRKTFRPSASSLLKETNVTEMKERAILEQLTLQIELRSERVDLFRVLLRGSLHDAGISWNELAYHVLLSNLKHLNGVTDTNLAEVVAVLHILGGSFEPLRRGARVRVQQFEKGVVLALPWEPERGIMVLTDSGDKLIIAASQHFELLPLVSVPYHRLLDPSRLISMLCTFLQTGRPSSVSGALLTRLCSRQLSCFVSRSKLALDFIEKGGIDSLVSLTLQPLSFEAPSTIRQLEERISALDLASILTPKDRPIKLSVEDKIEKLDFDENVHRVFTHKSDFDTNGVLYHLSSLRGGLNPATCQSPLVTVSAEGNLFESSEPIVAILGREAVRCGVGSSSPIGTLGGFTVRFLTLNLKLTHYTLRHYVSNSAERLRNWDLRGSNDGTKWDTIMSHVADTSLQGASSTHTWEVPSQSMAYSYFRIVMTGNNCTGNKLLACGGIEFYGVTSELPEVCLYPFTVFMLDGFLADGVTRTRLGPLKCQKGHILKLWCVNGSCFCDGCKKIILAGLSVLDCRACSFSLCTSCNVEAFCPRMHLLKSFTTNAGGVCDGCEATILAGASVHDCRLCNWCLCSNCHAAVKLKKSPGSDVEKGVTELVDVFQNSGSCKQLDSSEVTKLHLTVQAETSTHILLTGQSDILAISRIDVATNEQTVGTVAVFLLNSLDEAELCEYPPLSVGFAADHEVSSSIPKGSLNIPETSSSDFTTTAGLAPTTKILESKSGHSRRASVPVVVSSSESTTTIALSLSTSTTIPQTSQEHEYKEQKEHKIITPIAVFDLKQPHSFTFDARARGKIVMVKFPESSPFDRESLLGHIAFYGCTVDQRHLFRVKAGSCRASPEGFVFPLPKHGRFPALSIALNLSNTAILRDWGSLIAVKPLGRGAAGVSYELEVDSTLRACRLRCFVNQQEYERFFSVDVSLSSANVLLVARVQQSVADSLLAMEVFVAGKFVFSTNFPVPQTNDLELLYPPDFGVFFCQRVSAEVSDVALWRFALNAQHAQALGSGGGLAYIAPDLDEDRELQRGSETFRVDSSRPLQKAISIVGNGQSLFQTRHRAEKVLLEDNSPLHETKSQIDIPQNIKDGASQVRFSEFLCVFDGAFVTVTPKVTDPKNFTLFFEFVLTEVPENSNLLMLNTDQGVIAVTNGVLVCFGSPTLAKVSAGSIHRLTVSVTIPSSAGQPGFAYVMSNGVCVHYAGGPNVDKEYFLSNQVAVFDRQCKAGFSFLHFEYSALSFDEVQERWNLLAEGQLITNISTRSFETFGFGADWARDALRECRGERPQAVEWILANEHRLKLQHESNRIKQLQDTMLIDLTSLGFSEAACKDALRIDVPEAAAASVKLKHTALLRLLNSARSVTSTQFGLDLEAVAKDCTPKPSHLLQDASNPQNSLSQSLYSQCVEPRATQQSNFDVCYSTVDAEKFYKFISTRLSTEQSLSQLYFTQCLLRVLPHAPEKQVPLAQLVRLVEFSFPAGLADLQTFLHARLVTEAASIPTDAAFSFSFLQKHCPVASQLVSEALFQAMMLADVHVASAPESNLKENLMDAKVPNPAVLLWLMDLFYDVTTNMRDTAPDVKAHIQHARVFLFCPSLCSILVRGIVLSNGKVRLTLTRLIASLVLGNNLCYEQGRPQDVALFDATSLHILKQLMGHFHSQQTSQQYTPFFSALVDLNLSLEEMRTHVPEVMSQEQPNVEEKSVQQPSVEHVKADPTEVWPIFTFTGQPGDCGIIYFLGTQQGTKPFTTPVGSTVEVTSSSLNVGALYENFVTSVSPLTPAANLHWIDGEETNPPWFIVDLGIWEVSPYCYTLRHNPGANSGFARSWELQGQRDQVWCRISTHKNDVSFVGDKQRVCYPILPTRGGDQYYSRFRILMTGPNHLGVWRFCVSHFEVYGHLKRSVVGTSFPRVSVPKSKEGHALVQKHLKPTSLKDVKWFSDVLDTHRSIQVSVGQAKTFPLSFSVKVWTSYLASVGWNPLSLSLGCPTTQSSSGEDGHSRNAVDGFSLDSATTCTRTALEDNPWWEVDLTRSTRVTKVVIWPRGLNNGETLFLVASLLPITSEQVVQERQVVGCTENGFVWCPSSSAEVRFIRVLRTGKCVLQLNQVEVLGPARSIQEGFVPPLSAFYLLLQNVTVGCYQDLTQAFNEKSSTDVKQDNTLSLPLDLTPDDIRPYSQLSSLSVPQLALASRVLAALNTGVSTILVFADLSLPENISSLTDDVRKFRHCMVWRLKQKILCTQLEATEKKVVSRPKIEVDCLKSAAFIDAGHSDEQARYTVFGQCFQQLKAHPIDIYLIPFKKRMFEVKFLNLHATDAGGPYRDCLEKLCLDCVSPCVNLFILCPNARLKLGNNQDLYMPNPRSHSPFQLSLFKFLGRLMGMALRTRNLLNLSLPSLVWKPLCREAVNEHDVLAVDKYAYQTVDEIASMSELSEEAFNAGLDGLTFTTTSYAGQTVPLTPDGSKRLVTYQNHDEYVRLLKLERLSWGKEQVEALRTGLASVVPVDVLSLLTWQELERQVCGRGMRAEDVDILKANTRYSGHKETDDLVVWFWDILRRDFTDEQRAQFLTFCWGRSRLPLEKKDFETSFVLSTHNTSQSRPDGYFPVGHTCSFTLDLPKYSSRAILLRMLSTAVSTCDAIDAD